MSNSLRPHGLYSSWNSPGQNTRVCSCSPLQGIFPTQRSNPGLPHCRRILYQMSHQGSPRILEWVAYSFSRRSSRPRYWTRVSCIAGGFFTSWLSREAQYLVVSSVKDKRRSRRRKWQATPVFLSRKSHRDQSLAGYSPWCHKELDMTQRAKALIKRGINNHFNRWCVPSSFKMYFGISTKTKSQPSLNSLRS